MKSGGGEQMIKVWALRHFKSVKDEPKLELGKLTVFTGSNSSGKSTIIQSLLLTAQTLQSPVVTRPIVLNGHILRLGNFNDILSNGTDASSIEIGFQLSLDQEDATFLAQSTRPSSRIHPPIFREINSVSCNFNFSAQGDGGNGDVMQLQPRVEQCDVTVTARGKEIKLGFKRRSKSFKELMRELSIADTSNIDPDNEAFKYEITDFPNGALSPTRRLISERPLVNIGKTVGALLSHFLPNRLCIVYDEIEEQAEEFRNLLRGQFGYRPIELDSDDQSLMNDHVKTIVIEVLDSFNSSTAPFSPTTKRQFQSALDALHSEFSIEALRRCYTTLTALSLRNKLVQAMIEREGDIEKAFKQGKNQYISHHSPSYPATLKPELTISSNFSRNA